MQVVEIVRGLKGLNIVGGDVAEVSGWLDRVPLTGTEFHLQTNPLNDVGGVTSLMVANLMFELLCILPGVKYMDMSSVCNNDLI